MIGQQNSIKLVLKYCLTTIISIFVVVYLLGCGISFHPASAKNSQTNFEKTTVDVTENKSTATSRALLNNDTHDGDLYFVTGEGVYSIDITTEKLSVVDEADNTLYRGVCALGSNIYFLKTGPVVNGNLGQSNIYRVAKNGGTIEQLTYGNESYLVNSPKDALVSYLDEGDENVGPYNLYILDVSSRKKILVDSDPQNAFWKQSWSPDGNKMLYLKNIKGRNQLYIFDISNRKRHQLLINDSIPAVSFDWIPNGEEIIVGINNNKNNGAIIYQVDIINEDKHELLEVPNSIDTLQISPDGKNLLIGLWDSTDTKHKTASLLLFNIEQNKTSVIQQAGLYDAWVSSYSPGWISSNYFYYLTKDAYTSELNLVDLGSLSHKRIPLSTMFESGQWAENN